MQNAIRFILVLHDHQPVGNFDHVFEQAYQDSYKPFLDTFERYPDLKMGLHTSGPYDGMARVDVASPRPIIWTGWPRWWPSAAWRSLAGRSTSRSWP